MTFTDTQRFIITFAVLASFLAAGFFTASSEAYRIQGFVFIAAFGIGYTCILREWSTPISQLTLLGLLAYGLLFLEKHGNPPYLLPGWQWYIGALIALEIILYLRRIRKPQTL